MGRILIFASLISLVGCGQTAFHKRTIKNQGEVVASTVSQTNRWGDVDTIEEIDVGKGGGYGYGGVISPMARPRIMLAGGRIVTDGERAMENIPGGIGIYARAMDDQTSKALKSHQALLEEHEKAIRELENNRK